MGEDGSAGVALSAYRILDYIIKVAAGQKVRFVLFAHPEFNVPLAWCASDNLTVVNPSKFGYRDMRVWHNFAGTVLTRKYKLDLLFSPIGFDPYFVWTKRLSLIHDLFILTEPQFFNQKEVSYLRPCLTRGVPRARRIFTNSHHTKSEVMRVFGIPDERIVVLPFSVGHTLPVATSEEVLGTSPSDLGIPFKRFFFALSTVEPRKDVGTILRAAALIRRQLEDAECGIAIAGAKGWKTDSVFETYTQLGLENLVTFLGYVPDEQIPILFAKSEAFLCASLTEGFGMPVLEAHIYGAPVICTTGGALKEVSGPGALTFEPKDEQALAQNMIDVLATPEQRQARVEKGREHAKSYSWVKCAEIVLETIAKS